jgi:hypothetical protein
MAVTRSQFKSTLKHGVDLKNDQLKTKLKDSPASLDDLKALDGNQDGVLKGSEFDGVFNLVDGYDKNGLGRLFNDAGDVGKVFGVF